MSKSNGTKLKFFIQPLAVAIIITIIWYFMFTNNLFPKRDADVGVMSSGTISVLGILYALVAAFVLTTVWREFVAVQEAIKLRHKHDFFKHKDKRVPLPIKVLLLIFSLLLLGAFFIIHYNTVIIGMYSILSISIGLALNWAVIMDLDDPFEGIWNVEVPKHWHKLKNATHHKAILETADD
jgi:hypothetical protein